MNDEYLKRCGVADEALGAAKAILLVAAIAALAGICYALWWAW